MSESNGPKTPAAKPKESVEPTSTQPVKAEGHPVQPAEALRAWLQTNADRGSSRTMFRLPVVVVRDPDGLGITRAYIGTGLDGGGPPLDVKLGDASLGISLLDRLRSLKKDGAIAVWIEGHWGPMFRKGMPRTEADQDVITVRKVGERIVDASPNARVTIVD